MVAARDMLQHPPSPDIMDLLDIDIKNRDSVSEQEQQQQRLPCESYPASTTAPEPERPSGYFQKLQQEDQDQCFDEASDLLAPYPQEA